MDFTPSPEQEMIRKQVREFAEREIKPVAPKFDASGEFPKETVAKMAGLGLLGMLVPAEYDGGGLDTVTYAVAIEEVARVDGGHGLIMAAHNSLCTGNILIAGTKDQKRRYIPDLAAGRKVGAWALTEPASGSDAASMTTVARSDDGEWVIDGTKNLCTNAPVAGTFVIMAITDRSKGNHGISAFIVERGNPGLRIGKIEDKLGMRASATSQEMLEDCRVPKANLLGDLNYGFTNALKTLDGGRISIAALGVGIAQGAYEESVAYAKERKQFGKPIADFQAIQFMLADMALRIDAARMLTYRAAWLKDHAARYESIRA